MGAKEDKGDDSEGHQVYGGGKVDAGIGGSDGLEQVLSREGQRFGDAGH